MGTVESVFLGEDEGGRKSSELDDPLNYSNVKTSYSKSPKIVGYVIGDVQTGKSSLLCRLRGEDDLSGASSADYNGHVHSTEEVILPWTLLHPSSSPSNDVDFHVQIYPPLSDESSSTELISFALFLIDPKRFESTLKYAEEVARDLLQKQILRVTGDNTVMIPPWISICVLLNFCDEDSGVMVEESFFQQTQQLAQRVQNYQADLYLPYYSSMVSTKIMENNENSNDFCSYSICSSMKTCYGLQALYSFFPIVYHRWKEWNTILTILQLQKKNTLKCHKSMQKMAHLNQQRYFQKQHLKLARYQPAAVTAELEDNTPHVPSNTSPTTQAVITTDNAQMKEEDMTSEKQHQLARLRQMQKKDITASAERDTTVISPTKSMIPAATSHKLDVKPSTAKSSKVDAQKALDLFLAEEDDDDDDDQYKYKVYHRASLPFQEENSTTSNDDDDDFYYDQQGQKHQSIKDRKHTTHSYTSQQAFEEDNIKQKNDELCGSRVMSKTTAQMPQEGVTDVHRNLTSDDGWDWNEEDEVEISEAESQSLPSKQTLSRAVALEKKTDANPSTTLAERISSMSDSPSQTDLNENNDEKANPLLSSNDDYTQVEEVSSATRKATKDKKKAKKKKSHERHRQ